MTTDITELAQSLKAAAENAIGAHERLAAYPYGEIIDISQHEGEQIDIDITDINEFHEEASPANILALVEALEKAQQYAKERDAENQDLMLTVGRLRVEREELESRTVKLPEPFKLAKSSSGLTYYYADEVNEALSAAGIKWEAE
ncbi:ead/Ea22-like family protein [Raoultella ornithinolytica]|uniref:ead/Ea22-like family protein n=1 Tax=Raoultella ornithinolytica TaxID=54291 RepID=UPI001BDB63D5|nr:ead/Ea22-like family protein [Raoultella ornithinolytica]